MKKALSSWARLTRIDHGIMSAAGVVIGMLVMAKATGFAIAWPAYALAIIVPIAVQVAAFALNDYLDIETDKYNKRHDRPLVSGEIKAEVAKYTAVLGFIIGILCAFMINRTAGAIALVFSALSIAYDFKLKDYPLLGNIYIALSMSIAFIFGAAVVRPEGMAALPTSIALVCAIAFFGGLGREIVKTTQDMEGDKAKRGAKTLPIIVGRRNALLLAGVSYVVFALLGAWLLTSGALPFMALTGGLVLISMLVFLAMAYEMLVASDLGQERLAAMRKTSLYALMAGLAGILIAAL